MSTRTRTDQNRTQSASVAASLILILAELEGARIPQPEGTGVGLRDYLSANQPMSWHARGREGWLAPAQVSNKNGGGKPPFPTTSMLLKVGVRFHSSLSTHSRLHRASPEYR